MLTYHDGPSVTIDQDGNEWPFYTARVDCNAIADEFPELRITPDEAATMVEQMLERVVEEMYEYVPDWVRDLRGSQPKTEPDKDRVTYRIHWCWNGDEGQVDGTDEFDSRREWELVIENMPYDILDESDTECWVDFGDNDDWE